MKTRAGILIATMSCLCPWAESADIWVDASHLGCPGQGTSVDPFCRIQDALDQAVIGDRIVVASGIYQENLVVPSIVVSLVARRELEAYRGEGRPIVDGAGLASVVTVLGGSETTIRGFEIIGGEATRGGGIQIEGARATVEDCVIRDNHAQREGGGLFAEPGSSLHILGNSITNNRVGPVETTPFGGGISVDGLDSDHAWIEGNRILGNIVESSGYHSAYGGGISARHGGEVAIVGNLIAKNSVFAPGSDFAAAGGINFSENRAWIEHNTIVGNVATSSSGIHSNEAVARIAHCILWDNEPMELNFGSTKVTMAYCDVEGGYVGPGNLNVDPLFVDANNEDYRLRPDSPCVDAGMAMGNVGGLSLDLNAHPRPLDGDLDTHVRPDLGAFEFAHVELHAPLWASPGTTLSFTLEGTPGLQGWLFVGLAEADILLGSWGRLLIDWHGGALPSWPIPDLPSVRDVVIPGDVSIPLSLYVQALVIAPDAAGNVSRARTVTVR